MQKIPSFFYLLWLKLKVSLTNCIEWFRVIYRFYPNKKFRKIDIFLLRNYILENPYKISKKFLKKKGEKNLYKYGETPLTTLEKIVAECPIGSSDIVYELGCGRGRTCFWLHCFTNCRVIGVEYVPTFVKIASKAARTFDINQVSFLYRDILELDYSDATVIYFYGTSSSSSFILKLMKKFEALSSGTKIITISYPLTTYATKPFINLQKTFSVQFPWGETEAYLHVRR